jgi:hypothetical protein
LVPVDEPEKSTWVDGALNLLLVLLVASLALHRMGCSPTATLLALKKQAQALAAPRPAAPALVRMAGGGGPEREAAVVAFNGAAERWRDGMEGRKPAAALAAAQEAARVDPKYLNDEARSAVLLMQAQALVALNRPDEAIPLAERARSVKSGTGVYVTLATAHFKKEDYPQSLAYLRDYMDSGGKLSPDVYFMLGAAYDRVGEVDAAANWVQRGRSEFPQDKALADLANRYTRNAVAERSMTTRHGEHFILKFVDVPEQEAVRAAVADALETARRRLEDDFGFRMDRAVQVVIYPTSGAYMAASGVPLWAAGHYDGKIRIPVRGRPDRVVLSRIATHELTHHMVERLTEGRCPAWLNEGLAQLEERADASWVAAELARTRSRFQTRELEATFTRLTDPSLAHLAYAQSYAMTRDLVARAGLARVRDALADVGRGRRLTEALPEAAALY